MRKYFEGLELELADMQNTEEALERKLDYLKENEPYAKYEIENVETALRTIKDLIWDFCEEDE